jgi:hypothetical protein
MFAGIDLFVQHPRIARRRWLSRGRCSPTFKRAESGTVAEHDATFGADFPNGSSHKFNLRTGDDHAKNNLTKLLFIGLPNKCLPYRRRPSCHSTPFIIRRLLPSNVVVDMRPRLFLHGSGKQTLVERLFGVTQSGLTRFFCNACFFATRTCEAKACATRIHLQIKLPSKLSVVFSFTPVRDTSCLS